MVKGKFFIIICICSIFSFFIATFFMWLIPYGIMGSTFPPISDYWKGLLEGDFMGLLVLFAAIFICISCCVLIESPESNHLSSKRDASSKTYLPSWTLSKRRTNAKVQKVCPNCGTLIENPGRQKYCTSCGNKLD